MNAEATALRDAKRVGAPIPGRWSGPSTDAAARALVRLGLVPLRLLATPVGRRVSATAVLSLLLVGLVSVLYSHADRPDASARPLYAAAPAAASTPTGARSAGAPATGATKSRAASNQTLASVTRAAKDARSAAVAWYASHLRVSPDRVQALQQQRVNGTTVNVLVMAQVSDTNVPTAFVTVKRANGGWKVP
jgi:hypothetical protein